MFQNDRFAFRIILTISLLVFSFVIVLNEKIIPRPELTELQLKYIYKLPMFNAIINGTCSLLLLGALWAIRRKNVRLHKQFNLTAFFLSSLFLVSYITYHYLAGDTKFPSDHPLKYIYYFILFSHIILAALVLPLVLLSFHRALTQKIQAHRKIVRYTWPIWFYVTVSGVLVYILISPHYPY